MPKNQGKQSKLGSPGRVKNLAKTTVHPKAPRKASMSSKDKRMK